jgi:hypothetical protein
MLTKKSKRRGKVPASAADREAWFRPTVEHLEDRTLLSNNPLPTPFNAGAIVQTLLAPDVSTQRIPTGTKSELLQFALHGTGQSNAAQFDLAPVNTQITTTVSALAIFDSDGNLIGSANKGNASESLAVTLQSQQVYELGIYFDVGGAGGDYTLTTTPGPQAQSALQIDAGGQASAPVNTFGSASDVQYTSVNLFNGGASGTITVTATGLDVHAFAALFRRDNPQAPWQSIFQGTQSPAVTVPMTPPAGRNLTDAQYALAVAPAGFNTVAGSYAVDVAVNTLAPTTVDPSAATDLLTPPPVSLGTGQVTAQGALQNSAALYRFRAPTGGTATITFTSSALQTMLSAYDVSGTQLLGVASGSGGQTDTISLAVTAGTEYLVRVWDTGETGYSLSIQTPYQTDPLKFDATTHIASATAVQVDPATGAKVFRLTPDIATNVLAIQVTPQPGNSATFVLVGPNGVVATSPTVAPGAPLFVAVMLTGAPGPYDLMVEGTDGGGAVDVAVGEVMVAQTLKLDQLIPSELALSGKQLTNASQPAPNNFGDYTGLAYYQFLANDPTQTTTATLQGEGGAQALLVHYEQDGNQFRLAGFQVPDATGLAQVTANFHGNLLQGLAAYSLDLGGQQNPNLQFGVTTPPPAPIQLGTVRDIAVPLPAHAATMDTKQITLHEDFQQQLWQTILPQNMLGWPQVVFKPISSAGPVQATVSVYFLGQSVPFASGKSDAAHPELGVTLNLQDTNIPLTQFQGATLVLRVEVVQGGLGTGAYELTMKEATDDPTPYQVTETAWRFYGTSPQWLQGQGDDAAPGQLPNGVRVIDIPQNQLGQGQLTTGGSSGLPGFKAGPAGTPDSPNPDTIAVYRFWAITPGPWAVKTVAAPGSTVNTNIQVYRAKYSNGILYLGQLGHFVGNSYDNPVTNNLDWYQADRSQIDAQIYVNNFEWVKAIQPGTDPYGTGGGMYFVVVRNEQGTSGDYTIEVDAPPMPVGNANKQVTVMPASGGSVALNLPDLHGFVVPGAQVASPVEQDYVGYYPIQMPSFHTGTLTVTTANVPFFDDLWDFHLYDGLGQELPGITQQTNEGTTLTTTFTVPKDVLTVYLHVRRKYIAEVTPVGSVFVAASISSPVAPPVDNLNPSTAATILPTDPFGNATGTGEFVDSLKSAGDGRVYEFEAPAGAVKVNVAPDIAGDISLRWGAYVGNRLIAWGLGGGGDVIFTLPDLRQPGDSPDFDFDRTPPQDVKIFVTALTNPKTTGVFTINVQSNAIIPPVELDLADKPTGQPSPPVEVMTPAPKPLRDADLAIDPLTFQGVTTPPVPLKPSGSAISTNGLNWLLLSVPTRATQPVNLMVVAGILHDGETVRYDLYDDKGNIHSTGTAPVAFLPLPGGSATFSLPLAVGGASYFLRVGLVDAPEATVTVTASVSQFTLFPLPTPADSLTDVLNPSNFTMIQPDTAPNGYFSSKFVNNKELIPFWVGQGGQATFTGTLDPGAKRYLAVYRMEKIILGGGNEAQYPSYDIKLLDYQNQTDVHGNFIITADLDPGLYFLQAGGTSAAVTAQLQAYPLVDMVLYPQSGKSDPPLDVVDSSSVTSSGVEAPLGQAFRSTFYYTVAPLASNGPLTVTLNNRTLSQADLVNGGPNFHTAQGNVQIWALAAGTLQFQDFKFVNPLTPSVQAIESPAPPQTPYYIRFQRNILGGDAQLTTDFTVPESGTADLYVSKVQLSADSGMTRVDVTLENIGTADASATHASFTITDGNGHVASSDQQEPDIAPSGLVTYSFTFKPISINDTATFTANVNHDVQELNFNNDTKSMALSKVDPSAPTLTVHLADPALDQFWGRFVAGINGNGPHSDIVATVTGNNLYQVWQDLPVPGEDVGDGLWLPQSIDPSSTSVLLAKDFQFGALNRTDSGKNPNMVKAYVEDAFGLDSPEFDRQVTVVPRPNWLSGQDSTITWDDTTHLYNLGFHEAFIDYDKDVSQILTGQDGTIPLIGSAKNQFIVRMDSVSTAGLDPSAPVVAPLTGQITLTVLDQNLFNETFNGQDQLTQNISIFVSLGIHGDDLEAHILKVSFQFHNLQLFHYETPEIPLFTYGIPGVLNLNLNLKFLIDIMMNAGVSIGVPLDTLPPIVGLMAPTYVQPQVTLGARLSGAAQVLGFDVASIYGEVDFTLTVTVGLNTADPTALIPVTSFLQDPFSNLAVSITGQLGLSFGAEVLGFTVFSFSPQFPPFQISGTQGIPITTFPMLGSPPSWQPAQPLTGGSQLGALVTDPRPNVVIDPSGAGLYVQVADATSPGDPRGNLQFATRANSGSQWSPSTTLDQAENISNPVVALTHDQPTSVEIQRAPAVVVYQANKTAGINTLNDLLTAQDIRYRYWDGTAWHDEQALTADRLYDSNPVVAINNNSQGLAAWTHNTNPTPMGSAVDRLSNQIEVAVWDPINHVFTTPVMLTNTMGVGNSKPAVFAGDDNTLYVTWLREDAFGNVTPMTATYKNGQWSEPQVLNVSGRPAGAVIQSLAMGSDGESRVDVLMTAVNSNPGHAATSTLYNRVNIASNYLNMTPVETVADGSNFSFLHTTNDMFGNLVVSWEQSDGQTNDAFAAVRSASGTWSAPAPLSNDHGLKYAPAVAVDTDGTFQTVFETRADPGTSMLVNGQSEPITAPGTNMSVADYLAQPGPQAKQVGMSVSSRVGTTSIKPAPELGFSQALTFDSQTMVPSGAAVTGHAQVHNRGLAGTYVDIQYFDGIPGAGGVPVDSIDKIYLGPGHSFDINHAFKIKPGNGNYSILVTAVDKNDQPVQEEVGTADNVTTAHLLGTVDLAVTKLALSDPTPHDGETVQVSAHVQNLSNLPSGGWDVTLYRGDPRLSNQLDPAAILGTKHITLMPPNGDVVVTFPWTIPAGGGDFLLTVDADPKNAIAESTKSDNFGHLTLTLEPDAALVGIRGVPQPVTAQVLNYSGVNNVRINALVSNLGAAGVHQVSIVLESSLDNASYQQVGSLTIPVLAAHSHQTVTFTTAGLAGRNSYRVLVDPQDAVPDSNRNNNVGETILTLNEFPDLLIPAAALVETQTPAQGQALTLRATIKNQGIASARAVPVEVFAGDPAGGGLPIGNTTIDFMPALSSTTVDIHVDTAKLIGFENLYVIVNRLDDFPETSHFNNTYVMYYVRFYGNDKVPPHSMVDRLPATTKTPAFQVTWQGQDGPTPGTSGIASFDIYVSIDGGAYSLWLHTSDTSAIYHGQEGHHYAFYSLATDNAGNHESKHTIPDAQTSIPAPAGVIEGTVYSDANANRSRDAGEVSLAGWLVYLDLKHDGHLDPGDPYVVTGSSGSYKFTGLRAGNYTVAVVPHDSWVETEPGTPVLTTAKASHFLHPLGTTVMEDWANHGPPSTLTTTIWYDFRPIGAYANQITPAEIQVVQQALQAWSDASLGRLQFKRNTTASIHDIINIGVGNMAAVTGVPGPGLDISRGGAKPSAAGTLSDGVAWLDATQTWNTTNSAGPPGSYDFFTVMGHELGLTLGLAESADRTSQDLIYGFYTGPLTAPSTGDRNDIQTLYPVVPATTPAQPTSYTIALAPRQVVQHIDFGELHIQARGGMLSAPVQPGGGAGGGGGSGGGRGNTANVGSTVPASATLRRSNMWGVIAPTLMASAPIPAVVPAPAASPGGSAVIDSGRVASVLASARAQDEQPAWSAHAEHSWGQFLADDPFDLDWLMAAEQG